jgi:hypothetical protein
MAPVCRLRFLKRLAIVAPTKTTFETGIAHLPFCKDFDQGLGASAAPQSFRVGWLRCSAA